MHAALADRLQRALAERRQASNLRMVIARAASAASDSDDTPLQFASNDYLGLSTEPRVVAAFEAGARRYGVGATASALVCGYTDAHAELESAVARFTGRPRALLFSSGYLANLAVTGVLANRSTTLFEDRLNHASLIDAATLSRARLRRYPHLDAESLSGMLASDAAADRLILTDGVFSMDGDIAPLPALAGLAARHDATLIVDDAHGLGVVGPAGRGCSALHGLSTAELPVLIGTFGKAFGGAGAFVAGDGLLIEALQQFARPHIYTTAMPPALACAMLESLRIVATEPERQQQLTANIAHFRDCAAAAGLPLQPSQTPIQPILLGDNATVQRVGEAMRQHGFWLASIRPPTVPAGSARLRITVRATHRAEDITAMVSRLSALLRAG
jgi:8-amino-7-oxononanoate synthase